jgi:hypothetical protein
MRRSCRRRLAEPHDELNLVGGRETRPIVADTAEAWEIRFEPCNRFGAVAAFC